MNLQDLTISEVVSNLAGLAGSVVSIRFLQGTWPERVFLSLCGFLVSLYLAPWLSDKIGLPAGPTGFLTGMFGMAVLSRMWEWVQTTPVAKLWQIALDWLQRVTGTGGVPK